MGIRRGTATPTKIYRGTTPVKKVMRGTFEVWSASIAVTPAAPTFLTGSPWYTLPTQTGVTYTVSGTPGHSQTVTVTATAQAGYELVGQTSWTHTYGPPPRYTASDSGSYGAVGTTSWRTIATHTVASNGLASVQWTATRSVSFGAFGLRILVDGVVRAEYGPQTTNTYGYTLQFIQRQYTAGQLIEFQVQVHSFNIQIESWSWSLS